MSQLPGFDGLPDGRASDSYKQMYVDGEHYDSGTTTDGLTKFGVINSLTAVQSQQSYGSFHGRDHVYYDHRHGGVQESVDDFDISAWMKDEWTRRKYDFLKGNFEDLQNPDTWGWKS